MMTAKEKAKYLYDKFSSISPDVVEIDKETVKDYCIFLIDEIINTTLIEHSKEGHLIDEGYAVDYWNEVKKEINAL